MRFFRMSAVKEIWSFVMGAICFSLLFPAGLGCAASRSVALYRVGERGQDACAFLKQYLEARGYQVALYQGESTIEKHVEKANLINRGAAKMCIAVARVLDEKKRVLVARTEARKGEGRFLTVDEVPEHYAGESQVLADAVAGQFGVRAKRMPLFPLLGIRMPGIYIEVRGPEGDLQDIAEKLYLGMEKYFRKG